MNIHYTIYISIILLNFEMISLSYQKVIFKIIMSKYIVCIYLLYLYCHYILYQFEKHLNKLILILQNYHL